jgi:hypothetical protein
MATYFAIIDIRTLGDEDGADFCRRLPERCGVIAVPASVFYEDTETGRFLVRFAFCKKLEVIDEAVRRLLSLRRRRASASHDHRRKPIGLRDVVLTPVSRSWNPAGSVFRCGQDRGIDQRPLPSGCGQRAPIRSEIVWHAANRRSGTGCVRGLEQKSNGISGLLSPRRLSRPSVMMCRTTTKEYRSWRF